MSKVLILSGKPILSKREEEALAKDNVQVTTLTDCCEDLQENINEDYDLFILNNNLRGVDIHQMCRQIRGFSPAILILLDDKAEWEMWEKRKEIGFDRYYQKPIEPSELATRIKLMLSKRHRAQRTEVESKIKAIDTERDQPVRPSVTARDGDRARQARVESMPPPESPANIWQNPESAKLISSLLSGKITQITPEIDLSHKDGFSYQAVDNIMETSGRATSQTLESLAKEGILLKENFEQILVSPSGSVQLMPVQRCPDCDSSMLSQGKIIEHFACGHVGIESEFLSGLKHICPKCKKELKLIGTDYRSPGMRYVCHTCHGIFPAPKIKCRCLRTGEVYDLEELRHVWLYSYRLNEAHRKRLEFELEPKKQLVDYLNRLGYDVQESVPLQGRSGATHTIDLLASINDPVSKHTVAIGILAAPQNGEEVAIDTLFSFDSKIYDVGIDNKIVLAIPRLSAEAAKFAKRQGIRVYGIEALRALLSGQHDSLEIAIDKRKQPPVEYQSEHELIKLGPKGWLKWLLEKKGYLVTEDARVSGRSGAEHVLELYAHKDDGIISHKLAACVIMNGNMPKDGINEVIKFDTAAYDAGISHKVIITVPELTMAAKQFAEYQRIKVLEAEDLDDFSSKYSKQEPNPNLVTRNK
jgi:CheY-like chemotaxis protein